MALMAYVLVAGSPRTSELAPTGDRRLTRWQLLQNLWNGILDLTKLLVIPDWGALIALLPGVHGRGRHRLLRRPARPATGGSDRAAGGPAGSRRSRRPASTCPARPTPRSSPRSARSCCSSGSSSTASILVLGLIALRPHPALLGPRGPDRLRPRRRRPPAARRRSSTRARRPASTCRARRSGRSSPRSAWPSCSSASCSAAGSWRSALIFTIVALLGWLNDARKEYQQVVRADTTGHLENEPAPGLAEDRPVGVRLCSVVAVALNAGWFPPRSAVGGAERRRLGGAVRRPGGPAVRRPDAGGLATSRRRTSSSTSRPSRRPADKPFTDHLRQQGRRDPPRRRHPRRERQPRSFDGKDFPGAGDEDVRRPGPEGRHVQVRLLDPSRADERAR